LVPHGVAPLVAVAGLCAAGLVAASPPYRFAPMRWPAICLLVLLAGGAASAMWSVDPLRSLILDIRLAGLFIAGLALAMAAGRLANPRRLTLFLLAGITCGLALTWYDLLSGGGLSRHISVRVFHPFRLNQIAVGLAILALPVTAWLIERGRWALALMAAAMMVGTIGLLQDIAAKTAFAMSLPVMGLLYCWRGAIARLAAILSIIGILTAPLTLPALGRMPAVLAAADAIKGSAWHRLLIWSFVGERSAERPLLGWGLDGSRAIPGGTEEIRPGLKRLPLHPHNAALQLWLELGIPGALLSAFFVGWLWLRLGTAPWPRLYAAAAGGSLTAALVTASGAYGIWQEWWLGTLGLALFAVLVIARAAEPPAAATRPPPPDSRGAGR
jgi:exopolysaccharide production protein ExoQ